MTVRVISFNVRGGRREWQVRDGVTNKVISRHATRQAAIDAIPAGAIVESISLY